MTHNGTCMNTKGKRHRINWDYREPEISDDSESITFGGTCELCDTKFQKTYRDYVLTIISTSTGEPSDFNYFVDHLN